MDFSNKKVMIGLSGGINSMAVLCWLGELPIENRPSELHLFYAHFSEHSGDTLAFVSDGYRWAKSRFETVEYKQTDNSVMDYFEEKNFIPHPTNSACSIELKIEPMLRYCYLSDIQLDLVGYVAKEVKRAKRAMKAGRNDLFFRKDFPILGKSDEWCFEIVKRNIGWYPAIYDITENGKRVFTHNNCLPCKNMTPKQLQSVAKYYPDKYQRALEVQEATGSYFGRSKCDAGCALCKFD
jgi:hypothetical protein